VVSGVSWEQMVEEVVARGRPADVEAAAIEWRVLLGNIDGVCAALRENVGGLATDGVWSGAAAEAYARHIAGIADSLAQVAETARSGDGLGVEGALRKAAQDLAGAQAKMPVPLAAMGDVLSARHGHVSLGPDFFRVRLSGDQVDAVLENSPAAKVIDAFIRNKEQEARAVYDQVGDDYSDTTRQAPSPTAVREAVQAGRARPELGSPGGGTSSGGPAAGSSGGARAAGFLPSTSSPDLPGIGSGAPGGGLGGALPPDSVGNVTAGGGLAGVGPPSTAGLPPAAGLESNASPGGVGAVPGTGGLGPAGFGAPGGAVGSVASGVSAGKGVRASGPLGTGLPGGGALGKPVSPALGAVPMGGTGAPSSPAPKRGAGRSWSSGAVGAPGSGDRGQVDADRSTWLIEDEDVWGARTDAAPPVLRGEERP
jgi:hypothetical protein